MTENLIQIDLQPRNDYKDRLITIYFYIINSDYLFNIYSN